MRAECTIDTRNRHHYRLQLQPTPQGEYKRFLIKLNKNCRIKFCIKCFESKKHAKLVTNICVTGQQRANINFQHHMISYFTEKFEQKSFST